MRRPMYIDFFLGVAASFVAVVLWDVYKDKRIKNKKELL
jgi:hypothetical protein|tara:strand:+ start:1245 stop:1361 length:117 start_codon:yes stop_codon:yes gene_type:complete